MTGFLQTTRIYNFSMYFCIHVSVVCTDFIILLVALDYFFFWPLVLYLNQCTFSTPFACLNNNSIKRIGLKCR